MKVLVGLSGGVDSSVTAAILKEKGHDVIGVMMKIWDNSNNYLNIRSTCFGQNKSNDIKDAEKVCKALKIPFHVIDLSEEFKDNIINYFKNEYLSGKTPNPCVICNQKIKFKILLDKAKESELKFDYFATGHYAKVEYYKKMDRYILKKSKYIQKDQSYFLSFLSQEQLSKLLFPIGEYTKDEVRLKAKKLGFLTHNKRESQDFYSGDYRDLIGKEAKKGLIINNEGQTLGKHNGFWHYTIGQRRKLGISYKEPLYVIEIDKAKNIIIAGTEQELYKDEFIATNVNWISIDKLDKQMNIHAKIRYMHKEARASVIPIENDEFFVKFDTHQRAITPGQIVVFYDNDIVVGGGVIK